MGRRVLRVCTSRVVGTLMKNRERGPGEREIWGLEVGGTEPEALLPALAQSWLSAQALGDWNISSRPREVTAGWDWGSYI